MSNKHLHGIEAVYLPPSNFKGARLKLNSHRFKRSVTYKWNEVSEDEDNVNKVAEKILEQHGYTVVGFAQLKKGYLMLVEEFKWEL